MQISQAERDAIKAVLNAGRTHGYGNMISHLKTAWAAELVDAGMPVDLARESAGGGGYPVKMQRDLIERGEWDETGAAYSV